MDRVHILEHPLIRHKLTLLRDKNTGVKDFRETVAEIAMLMCYEVTRTLPLEEVTVETPVAVSRGAVAGKMPAFVPILRAGLGMVEGVLRLIPQARVGHIGLYRDPDTLRPVEYYRKMPPDIAGRDAILLDPMLATGGSAAAAAFILKEYGCRSIKLMSILAAPDGLRHMTDAHPDADIYLCALDERLNEHGYIVPGLGDAGDRIFGTK